MSTWLLLRVHLVAIRLFAGRSGPLVSPKRRRPPDPPRVRSLPAASAPNARLPKLCWRASLHRLCALLRLRCSSLALRVPPRPSLPLPFIPPLALFLALAFRPPPSVRPSSSTSSSKPISLPTTTPFPLLLSFRSLSMSLVLDHPLSMPKVRGGGQARPAQRRRRDPEPETTQEQRKRRTATSSRASSSMRRDRNISESREDGRPSSDGMPSPVPGPWQDEPPEGCSVAPAA